MWQHLDVPLQPTMQLKGGGGGGGEGYSSILTAYLASKSEFLQCS